MKLPSLAFLQREDRAFRDMTSPEEGSLPINPPECKQAVYRVGVQSVRAMMREIETHHPDISHTIDLSFIE